MLPAFNKAFNNTMMMVETDFSAVTTHNFEKKEQVKQIQNAFLNQRISQRNSNELLLCLVGNSDGLESHIQEYKAIGFNNPGQIIVVERQPRAAAALVDKAIELGYKHTSNNPSSTDANFFKELKVYNTSIDLSNPNLGLRSIEDVVPFISHIDFDGTEPGYTENSILQNISSIFSHKNIKSAVLVYTVNRGWGGLETQTTANVNAEVEDILDQPFTCNTEHSTYFATWKGMGVRTKFIRNNLEYFLRLSAAYREQSLKNNHSTSKEISSAAGQLKRNIKQLVANSMDIGSPVDAAYRDILAKIKAMGGISAKIIPYLGRANMFSIVLARDSNAVTELDISLKSTSFIQSTKSLIKVLCKRWPLNEIVHSTTKKSLQDYLTLRFNNNKK